MEGDRRIAILLATHNGAAYLDEQLNSIFAQTVTNTKLYVSDDDSKDQTIEILERYQAKYPDRMTIIKGFPRFGSAKKNFWNLLNYCDADYFFFCDQDDVWNTDKIEITYQKLREMESKYTPQTPILVFSDLIVVNEKLQKLSSSFLRYSRLSGKNCDFRQLLTQNVVTGCAMAINRALKSIATETKDASHMMMHDWWLALVASGFGKIGFIDRSTLLYRQHAMNAVGAKNVSSIQYIWRKIRNHQDMRKAMQDASIQSGEFLCVYGDRLKEDQRELLNYHSNLYKYGKIKRLMIMCKYRLWKYGLLKKVAQVIWS